MSAVRSDILPLMFEKSRLDVYCTYNIVWCAQQWRWRQH